MNICGRIILRPNRIEYSKSFYLFVPERGGSCRQIGLLLYSVGSPGPSLLLWKKKESKNLNST